MLCGPEGGLDWYILCKFNRLPETTDEEDCQPLPRAASFLVGCFNAPATKVLQRRPETEVDVENDSLINIVRWRFGCRCNVSPASTVGHISDQY